LLAKRLRVFSTGSGDSNSVVTRLFKTQKENIFMAIKNPKELFVLLLSDLRQGAERATKIFQEIG